MLLAHHLGDAPTATPTTPNHDSYGQRLVMLGVLLVQSSRVTGWRRQLVDRASRLHSDVQRAELKRGSIRSSTPVFTV